MPKPKPRMVLRQEITVEYEIAADAYDGYTNAEVLEQEKAMPFSSWVRQTDYDVISDQFATLAESEVMT